MKTILVTGGAGFIGSHTVVELAAAGYRPVILDNFSNSNPDVVAKIESIIGSSLSTYNGNFQDQKLVAKIISVEKPVGVIHFAAFKAVAESVSYPLKYYSNNVSGFVNFLEVLLEHKIYNFVFSSSAAVYGEPPVKLVTEDTACSPASPYGWSKYFDEVILKDTCVANPGLKGVALRYFNVVGAHPSAKIGELPKGKPQNLLPIITQAASGILPPLTVFGTDYATPDGTCLRDYVHVVDLARAHVAALDKIMDQKSGAYDVFNIGTGKPTSVLELIQNFEKINKVKVPHKIGRRRPGDPAAYYASAAKANKQLGWQAQKTVADAVADAWRWQQTL